VYSCAALNKRREVINGRVFIQDEMGAVLIEGAEINGVL
jgi:hypothetical protein